MLRPIVFFLFLLFCLPLHSQIINTESLRLNVKKEGWQGFAEVGFNIRRNKAGRFFDFNNEARLEYLKNNHRLIFLGTYYLTLLEDPENPDETRSVFSNRAFGHIRYNYRFNAWFVWEAFTQVQRNVIQEINVRALWGTGPRFNIVRQDSLYLNLGGSVMYEYEEDSGLEDAITYHRDFRATVYAAFTWLPSKTVGFNHTLYYQPRINRVSDYRITSMNNLSFGISKYLSFQFYLNFIYDAAPPETVPRLIYAVRNGIRFQF